MNIQGTGIELTDAIKAYVQKKIGSLTKFFDRVVQIDVDIGKMSNHHNKGPIYYAEVNMIMPGNNKLYASEKEEDVYAAIDRVKDQLYGEIEKMKGKMRAKDKAQLRGHKQYAEV